MDHRVAMPVRMTPTMGLELSFNSTTTIRHGAALHHGLSFQPTVRRCSREASIRPARCLARGQSNGATMGDTQAGEPRYPLPRVFRIRVSHHRPHEHRLRADGGALNDFDFLGAFGAGFSLFNREETDRTRSGASRHEGDRGAEHL
ncbi:hypothetical protein RIF29_02464 [Crotalaria pallida]|uniref:Uncharacterized protein n=1 Tax=Crotalaria pallida TaxID=3830 RepID=A0AAN9IYL2_CROPI